MSSDEAQTPLISVVIPACNEQELIRSAIAEVGSIVSETGLSFEIVVVDDGSTDSTWQLIKQSADSDRRVRGFKLSRNFGKESAICAGLSSATGDATIVLDADLQHPPTVIPKLIERWREGHLIVDAMKQQRGKESRLNNIFAKAFYKVFNSLSGFDLEGQTDFKLLDRQVIDEWQRLGERNVFFRGMTAWLGFPRAVVEFDVAERKEGSSRWTLLGLIDLAISALTSFSAVPLRLVTAIGGLFLVVALLMGVHTLYNWVSGNASVGFTTVILLVLITSSVLMIALGIIGEYLARIFEEIKARPRFVIEEECGVRTRKV